MFIKDNEGFLQEVGDDGTLYDLQILLPKNNIEELNEKLMRGSKLEEVSGQWNVNTKLLSLDSPIFELLYKLKSIENYKEVSAISEVFDLNIELQIEKESSKHTYNSYGSFPDEEFSEWEDLEGMYKDSLIENSPDIVIAKYYVEK